MQTVDIREAETHSSRLAEPAVATKRLGFLGGPLSVPEDFDRMGETEIVRMFEEASCS